FAFAGGRVHQGRTAVHDRHAFLEVGLRQAGGLVDDRVAHQELFVRGDAAGACRVGAQVELHRVVVAVGAGVDAVGAATARPQGLDVLGVVDDPVHRHEGLQV